MHSLDFVINLYVLCIKLGYYTFQLISFLMRGWEFGLYKHNKLSISFFPLKTSRVGTVFKGLLFISWIHCQIVAVYNKELMVLKSKVVHLFVHFTNNNDLYICVTYMFNRQTDSCSKHQNGRLSYPIGVPELIT